MAVLVTGGAGYIGSHITRLLGDDAVVVDNLSSGLSDRISGVPVEQLDLAAPNAQAELVRIIKEHKVDSVIHLAARKLVGESVERPEWYYSQNIGGMANLLGAMRETGVNKLVFSSSAATYGLPDTELVNETADCKPINPYGETKLVGEWMAKDAATAWGLKHVNLRYFNVAGAGAPELADTAVANLIPIVFAALKSGGRIKVFGDQYPTPDGSCIRDYVHVQDLADAHVLALDYLDRENREYDTFNVGTGTGASVFTVIDVIHKTVGFDFEVDVVEARAGDPARLCADVSRIKSALGWTAKHDLNEIVRSAWAAIS